MIETNRLPDRNRISRVRSCSKTTSLHVHVETRRPVKDGRAVLKPGSRGRGDTEEAQPARPRSCDLEGNTEQQSRSRRCRQVPRRVERGYSRPIPPPGGNRGGALSIDAFKLYTRAGENTALQTHTRRVQHSVRIFEPDVEPVKRLRTLNDHIGREGTT